MFKGLTLLGCLSVRVLWFGHFEYLTVSFACLGFDFLVFWVPPGWWYCSGCLCVWFGGGVCGFPVFDFVV